MGQFTHTRQTRGEGLTLAKPTILTVDDDPAVSQAITRDLRGKYGAEYQIVRSTSGAEALAVLSEFALRDRHVALIASDQRMPGMTGVEFLEQARAARARRQARAADGLRRHRCGNQGDQRHRPRLLPAQAVGSAGGAPVPRPRRPLERLARRAPGRLERVTGRRAPLVGADPRDQDLPGAQSRAVPLARSRTRRRSAATARCRARERGRPPARAGSRRRAVARAVDSRPLPTRSACARAPSNRCTTCASSAVVRRGSRPRSTARRRDCRPSSSSAKRRADRPARARPSRTISGSRKVCPVPT